MPRGDWVRVKIGAKTEFRVAGGRGMSQLWSCEPPTPVVAYTLMPPDRYESKLMILEAHYREAVGAITPDSLAREGFPDMAHFRRYWMGRTKRRFRPLQEVAVYRVRPFAVGDREAMAAAIMDRLYGEHLREVA